MISDDNLGFSRGLDPIHSFHPLSPLICVHPSKHHVSPPTLSLVLVRFQAPFLPDFVQLLGNRDLRAFRRRNYDHQRLIWGFHNLLKHISGQLERRWQSVGKKPIPERILLG